MIGIIGAMDEEVAMLKEKLTEVQVETKAAMDFYKPVFDARFYADKNPDLKKAFGYNEAKLFAHFYKYGMNEGRQASKSFNLSIYKANYSDLQNAFKNDYKSYYKHYTDFGYTEGRIANKLIKEDKSGEI